jgi:hypothetical protein
MGSNLLGRERQGSLLTGLPSCLLWRGSEKQLMCETGWRSTGGASQTLIYTPASTIWVCCMVLLSVLHR